jgi:hypothetical protein
LAKEGEISYPSMPLVKNKTVRVLVIPNKQEIFVVFDRKIGYLVDSLKLTLAEYKAFKGKFGLIMDLIGAVQKAEPVAHLLEGQQVLPDFYGWKYCRFPLTEDLKMTLSWNEEKRYALTKVHRGSINNKGTWVPDKKAELTLCAGGMKYFTKYTSNKLDRAIEGWKQNLESVAEIPAGLLFEYVDEPIENKDYEEEIKRAVASIASDSQWCADWA